jgi:glucosamine-6-phosphate deaminase
MVLIKSVEYDLLKIKIYNIRTEAGQSAALEGAAAIQSLLDKKEYVNIIFAAAPSQDDTLYELSQQKDIDWKRIRAFHMDEYVGFDANHSQSFGWYLNMHIFNLLPFMELHFINGTAQDTEKECERYAALIREYPPDIIFLGIGENGHIAFNDPGVADFHDSSLVKIVPLDHICRMQQVHDGCFASLAEVPTHAYTLTIPALTNARYMFCTVPRASKAEAVFRTVTEPINEDCPSTIMRSHPRAVMYCDSESAARLL